MAKTPDRSTPEHHPYVPDDQQLPEFTWGAVIVGSLLGIVFGASSLYLVLKVGLTVSASIPVAVLSITLFRVFSKVFKVRKATILENNIVQTAGSAGESIAFGVGVTMPALMILGFEMDISRVMVVSVLGSVLGILMMIPLRRAFIVKQHGTLKYPEGTACADVLIVGEQGGASAKTVFVGFGLAFVYQFLLLGMKLWKEVPSRTLAWYKGATAAIEVNPVLLGVGYIIGTRIACIMAAGGILASFVLTPMIKIFGDDLARPLAPGKMRILDMPPDEIRNSYILYIGAGAVTAGGIISLFQSLPLIIGSLVGAVRDMRGGREGAAPTLRRTDRDMPLWLVGAGSLLLIGAIWSTNELHRYVSWIPQLEVNEIGALMIVLFGFLFVTVSSRLTGEIGSSSNPISGMTVATLLLTCLVFYFWHHEAYAKDPDLRSKDIVAALSIGAIVCIAASNGGTTSQDLKTGYLVGATPVKQQWAIVIGAVTSALVMGALLVMLNNANTIYSVRNLPALQRPLDVNKLTDTESPRGQNDTAVYHVWHATEGNAEGAPPGKYLVDDAGRIRYLVDPGITGKLDHTDGGDVRQPFDSPKTRLMALITEGILRQSLPWTLVLLGVFIAIVLELAGVPSLPFAVGVYLPVSASMPIFVGGLTRYVADRWGHTAGQVKSETDADMSPGVLLSTGYIAGGSIAGMLAAFLLFSGSIPQMLAKWEYREADIGDAPTFNQQLFDVAAGELRIPKESEKEHADEITKLYWQMVDLNRDRFAKYAAVRAGTTLRLPGENTPFVVPQDMALGDIAKQKYKSDDEAQRILQLNEEQIPAPDRLPPGVKVRLPQETWPAIAAFSVLVACLLLVGLGYVMSGNKAAAPAKKPAPTPPSDPSKAPDRKKP